MIVKLKNLDILISHLPHTIKELCSQFMYYSMDGKSTPTTFEASVSIEDIEELGFNYIYIEENENDILISTKSDELAIDVDELNYGYDVKDWDEQVEDSIVGFGNFLDIAEKLKRHLKIKGKTDLPYSDIVDLIAEYSDIDFDEYDIICIKGSKWVYDTLSSY